MTATPPPGPAHPAGPAHPTDPAHPAGPAHPDGPARLDTSGDLLHRIGTTLAGRLGRLAPDGRRLSERPALVVVAHGSRDPRALTTVTALLDRVRALRPGLPVHLGHIELSAPPLPDTLAALDARDTGAAVLVPLLFGRGHHVKRDIPALAAGARTPLRVAAPLGPHPLLVDALHERLTEAGWPVRPDAATRRTGAVVLASAGSRDPEGRAAVGRTARLLAARLGVPVVAAHASAAAPTVPDAVRDLAARGRHRVAVASCFTAPGRFATACAEAAPWIASAPLGTHPALARLLLHRYDEALAAPVPRPVPQLAPA